MKSISSRGAKILAAVLAAVLIFSSGITAVAANGFRYRHDPCQHPSAMKDIVVDETAIYGYRPSETGSLKAYASMDWTDPDVVAQGRLDRLAYHESIESMYVMLQEMQAQGKSTEEIARAVSTRRNEIRLEAYADDPEGLAAIKARNLEKYGHEEGPLPDELYVQYGSWERVMEKAFSCNAGMDACLGLYDDYYFLYAAMGDVPADVVVTVPESLDCVRNKTVTFSPVIVSNTANYTVSFVSDDPDVVSVDENGIVTGVSYGSTDVRCIVTDPGGFTHTSEPCRVTVRSKLWQLVQHLLAILRYWQRSAAVFC